MVGCWPELPFLYKIALNVIYLMQFARFTLKYSTGSIYRNRLFSQIEIRIFL